MGQQSLLTELQGQVPAGLTVVVSQLARLGFDCRMPETLPQQDECSLIPLLN